MSNLTGVRGSTFFFLISFLFSVTFAQTPTTSTFTDAGTGITFQRFFGARTQFAFGIALPLNPSTDFIGQIECPVVNSAGWGGISMTGEMEGPLLLAAWPDGAGGIVSTFRVAQDEETSPPVVTGDFSVQPIPAGTSSNATHMKFTFLCTNCISAQNGFSAADTAGVVEMGWALADIPVSNAADPATELSFHNVGFSSFDAQLSLARNAAFGDWALLAGATSNGSTTPVPVTATNPITTAPLTGVGSGQNDSDDGDDDDEGQVGNVRNGGTTISGGRTREGEDDD